MLTLATEMPLRSETTVDELIRVALTWIAGSPHSRLPKEMLPLGNQVAASHREGDERVDVLRADHRHFSVGGLRYTRLERGKLEWVTTVVGHQSAEGCWVGIRVSCDSIEAGRTIPAPKKPQIIKLLLEQIGGGRDGDLDVSDKPIRLQNADVDFAAALINGETANALPVVYVSALASTEVAVDVEELARWLSGMAHVVVEPNRAFSLRLMHEVNGRNAYGGAVGVYWPKGHGRRLFAVTQSHHSSRSDLQTEIAREIRIALAARRPRPTCTWAFLAEAAARVEFERLRADKNTSVEAYIENFDTQLRFAGEQLDAANREVARLQAELRSHAARTVGVAGSVLSRGIEQEFYPHEFADILIDVLERAADAVVPDSRRAHVIEDLLKANTHHGEGERITAQLKSLFKDYQGMDQRTRRILEDLGFALSDDGKHIKAVYREDGRYTFSLAKTGSDYRGGKNMASDIIKKLF